MSTNYRNLNCKITLRDVPAPNCQAPSRADNTAELYADNTTDDPSLTQRGYGIEDGGRIGSLNASYSRAKRSSKASTAMIVTGKLSIEAFKYKKMILARMAICQR